MDIDIIPESDLNDLQDFIMNLENSIHQISFCKNELGQDFASNYYHGSIDGKEEYFGFTMPRMWEQYAENYLGVCIAFSKKKILSLNNECNTLLEGDVKYMTNSQLKFMKMGDICLDSLLNDGLDVYLKKVETKIKEGLFYKHKNYIGENEYRIVSQFDKKRCLPVNVKGGLEFDSTMLLDISGCIEALFVSSYANDRQKMDLLAYANNLNVPMIEMSWQYNSFDIIDYKLLTTVSNNYFRKSF